MCWSTPVRSEPLSGGYGMLWHYKETGIQDGACSPTQGLGLRACFTVAFLPQHPPGSEPKLEPQVNFSFRAVKTVAAPRLSEKELPGHRSTAETTCLQKMSPRHPQVTEQTAACESSWTRCQVPKRGCRESHEFNGHAGKSRHPPSQH